MKYYLSLKISKYTIDKQRIETDTKVYIDCNVELYLKIKKKKLLEIIIKPNSFKMAKPRVKKKERKRIVGFA